MIKQKVYYLLPEILDQLSDLNIGFAPATFDGNLVQLIVRLNPDFDSCSSFALSSLDKVTVGEKSFVSAVANVVAWFSAELDQITQLAYQCRIRLISQFNRGNLRVLQKIFRYFNGTIFLTSFVSSLPIWPVIFSLKLNDTLVSFPVKSTIIPASIKTASSL